MTFGVRNGRSRRRGKNNLVGGVSLGESTSSRPMDWGRRWWVHLSQKLLHARDQVKKKRETRSDHHHHQHHHEEEEDRGFFLLAPIHSFIPSTSLFVMTQSRRSDGLGKPALGRGRQKICCKVKNKETRKSFMKRFLYLLKGMHAERNEYARKKGPIHSNHARPLSLLLS